MASSIPGPPTSRSRRATSSDTDSRKRVVLSPTCEVVEVVVPHRDPGEVVLVVLEPGGDQRGQLGDVDLVEHVRAPADRHLLAEALGVVVPVGDEDRLLGAQVEPVQADRGHVGDHRVAVGHHGEDVADRDGDVAGRRVAAVGLGDQRRGSAWCAARIAGDLAGGDLGVRLVDQPHVGHGEHRAHDVGAEGVDGGVVVVLGVALPGRRVEDGTTRRSARARAGGRRSSCGRPMRTRRVVSNSRRPASWRCTAASPATKTRS